MALNVGETLRPAGVRGCDGGNTLAEGALITGGIEAAKAAQPEPQPDGSSLPGQIRQGALIRAMAPAGQPLAGRTNRGLWAWGRDDDEVAGFGQDLDDAQRVGHQRQKTFGQ
jgi:hypothetical protein